MHAAPVLCGSAACFRFTGAHLPLSPHNMSSEAEGCQATPANSPLAGIRSHQVSADLDICKAARDGPPQDCNAKALISTAGEGIDDCGNVLEERAGQTSPGQHELQGHGTANPQVDHSSAGERKSFLLFFRSCCVWINSLGLRHRHVSNQCSAADIVLQAMKLLNCTK